MALERQSIEKKDFPIGRRGYDPDAVDAHLRAIADAVAELQGSARRRTETLASTASEQVRTIVEAAETSAAEIRQQAEEEARELRAEANSEARATRENATAQAREYIANVSEATAAMAKRLDSMDAELTGLLDSLRSGSNRLGADLQLLSSSLSEMRDSLTPRPGFEPERDVVAPSEASATPEGQDESRDETARADAPEGATASATEEAEEPAPAGLAPDNGAEDVEGARLIALNMALNGTPREETDRYLAENFTLADRSGLLDEVYASVQG